MKQKTGKRRPAHPGRKERRMARSPHIATAVLETIRQHRIAALDCRSLAEIEAGTALGLAAMREGNHSAEKLRHLRALANLADCARTCHLDKCRAAHICTDDNVFCFWARREEFRAHIPHIDDVLARL